MKKNLPAIIRIAVHYVNFKRFMLRSRFAQHRCTEVMIYRFLKNLILPSPLSSLRTEMEELSTIIIRQTLYYHCYRMNTNIFLGTETCRFH